MDASRVAVSGGRGGKILARDDLAYNVRKELVPPSDDTSKLPIFLLRGVIARGVIFYVTKAVPEEQVKR
jgi:hypothetical protein